MMLNITKAINKLPTLDLKYLTEICTNIKEKITEDTVTHGKRLPQFCFPLYARNMTKTILSLFCAYTMHISCPHFYFIK